MYCLWWKVVLYIFFISRNIHLIISAVLLFWSQRELFLRKSESIFVPLTDFKKQRNTFRGKQGLLGKFFLIFEIFSSAESGTLYWIFNQILGNIYLLGNTSRLFCLQIRRQLFWNSLNLALISYKFLIFTNIRQRGS